MIRQNTFISIFGGLSLLLLPIYPNSSTIDFGGHIDVSLVYIFILLITGISKTKVLIGLISLFFYQSLSDSYSYIELAVKILTSYIFIIYPFFQFVYCSVCKAKKDYFLWSNPST